MRPLEKQELRLYTFTANLYLSPLQVGLQTAHIVGELSASTDMTLQQRAVFDAWAAKNKTIIILGAGNHRGVVEVAEELEELATKLDLPHAVFYEDEVSMNGMATAAGVVVPRQYFDIITDYSYDRKKDVVGYHHDVLYQDDYTVVETAWYDLDSDEGRFCHLLKSYRLA